MRLTILLVLTALFGSAEARPRSTADEKLVAALFTHVDQVSTILEKKLDDPKAAVKQLDRYVKKMRKKVKQTIGKLAAAVAELDDTERADLRSELMWSETSVRFLKALGAFRDKWGEDPTYGPKIDAYLEQLGEDGRPLFDALNE